MTVPGGSESIQLEHEARAPEEKTLSTLVLAHPHPQMGGDMYNKVIDQLFRRSAEKKWGAVRFNFRGVGKSTGAYDRGIGETEDLLAIIRWTTKTFGLAPEDLTLIGYSFGSWICAKAATQLPELGRLVLIAPPVGAMNFPSLASFKGLKSIFAAEKDEITSRENLDLWFASLPQPKTIEVIPKADHFFVGGTTVLIQKILKTID